MILGVKQNRPPSKPVPKPPAKMLVVLPFYFGDEWLLLKNLEWLKELDGKLDYDCLLSCDDQTDPTNAAIKAREIFNSVSVCRYPRTVHEHWPFNQNNAFMHTAWHVYHHHNGPWFWCETDCTLTRSGAIDALYAEYQRGRKPFGGHLNPNGNIFNGVAIYPHAVCAYAPKMVTAALIESKNDGKPYQPPWDFYGSTEAIPNLHRMNHVMQHLWDMNGKAITFPTQESVDRLVRPEVLVFHRVKDGTLVDRLRERRRGFAPKTLVECQVSDETVHAKAKPRVEIFIVTFKPDAIWLGYCLKSIRKFAKGFSGVTVAFPAKDASKLASICADNGAKARLFDEVKGKGHLHHNVIKCSADLYCPDADFILHMDSDCLFICPVVPDDYLTDGRAVLLIEEYARLKSIGGSANADIWKPAVDAALKTDAKFETMRRHPAIHPRALYKLCRERVEQLHGMPFQDYVLAQRSTFPYGFAEFNTLGHLALTEMKDSYRFIDVATEQPPQPKVWQGWTHGKDGIDTPKGDEPYAGKTWRQIAEMFLA